jgi:hypothetical protein
MAASCEHTFVFRGGVSVPFPESAFLSGSPLWFAPGRSVIADAWTRKRHRMEYLVKGENWVHGVRQVPMLEQRSVARAGLLSDQPGAEEPNRLAKNRIGHTSRQKPRDKLL